MVPQPTGDKNHCGPVHIKGNALHSMKYPYLILLTSIALAGCFDGDSDGSDTQRGQVTPTGIKGLSYQTASQTGTTDEQGHYRFYEGERLQLKVGDLLIADGVPAREVITPLEFVEAARTYLQTPLTNDEGLLTHKLREDQALEGREFSKEIINRTRMLLALNWEENLEDGDGIDIRDRVIEQVNALLPYLEGEIDYSQSIDVFAVNTDEAVSPANVLLDQICFAEEDSELCEEPPTDAEIDAAPPQPDDEEPDPDIEYKEQLENKRDRILNARRSLSDASEEDAIDYLRRELRLASAQFDNQYYLKNQTAEIPASDTSIKTVTVEPIGDAPPVIRMEAKSTNPEVVAINAVDWQSSAVEFYVTGDSGQEAEILVNFQTEDSYRWVKKQLRVVVQ